MTKLSVWMAENRITDETLAAQVEVSRTQVLRLRTGQNKPSAKTAKALERVTGIPAADFIFDADLEPAE